MTDAKPVLKYIYEMTDAAGKLRHVEARNKEQAIAHVFRPQIRTLSARDAVTIARNPNIVVEVAGEKLVNQELPLTPPSGADGASAPVIEPSLEGVPTQAPTEIVDQATAQSEPEPASIDPPAEPKKKGLFGRSAA